jgi:hypothetical protein
MTNTTTTPNATSDDQGPGDEHLVTFRARVHGSLVRMQVAPGRWIKFCRVDNPIVVRVEPAPTTPPTGFGARIRATVTAEGETVPDVVLVRVDFDAVDHAPWRGQTEIGGSKWFADCQLSDIVVLDLGEPA